MAGNTTSKSKSLTKAAAATKFQAAGTTLAGLDEHGQIVHHLTLSATLTGPAPTKAAETTDHAKARATCGLFLATDSAKFAINNGTDYSAAIDWSTIIDAPARNAQVNKDAPNMPGIHGYAAENLQWQGCDLDKMKTATTRGGLAQLFASCYS